jgi:predicted nucleotidyltransferase
VYNALGELKDSVAFVGGATVSLYADKPEQADVRPTEDIDVLIEIGTYMEYTKLQDYLNKLGFELDTEAAVICRYKYQGLTVDVMPTDENVLGFSNRWYKKGFEHIIKYQVDDQVKVNIFSSPYFIASKLEAFNGRGRKDGRTSQDFEDIVFVLDNRKSIWAEMQDADVEVRSCLMEEWAGLLRIPYHEEWISAHLEYETAYVRARSIITSMRSFVGG